MPHSTPLQNGTPFALPLVIHPRKAVPLSIRHVLLPRTPQFMAPTSAEQTDFQARLSFWVSIFPAHRHLIIPRKSHMPKLPVDQQNNDPLRAAHYNTFVFYPGQQTTCQISTKARRVQSLLFRSFFFSPGKSCLVSLPLRTLERKSAGNQC